MPSGGVYCCALGCTSNNRNEKISFFRFPTDAERCKHWLKNSGRSDLCNYDPQHLHRNYKLCSLHFQESAFAGLCRNRLKKDALPTVFNFPTPADAPDVNHQSCEQNIQIPSENVSPTVIRVRKQKQAAVDPLSIDGVPTAKEAEVSTNYTPTSEPFIIPVDPLIVPRDCPIIPKEEPIDVDTSNNVPGFEMVALPGCSTWTDEVTKEPAASSDTLVSDVPQPSQKICRLCMSSEDLIGIYDPVSLLQELSSKIIEVCAIPIHEGDGLPQYICQTCMTTVQKFYDFRLQCSVTDVTLKAEHTNTVLASTKRKRRGIISEFQKLNKRLKANIQSFYDLIDSINEFQDKVQCQLEDTATSSKRPANSQTHGTKRTAEKPSQKGAKNTKFTSQSAAIPETLPDLTSTDTQLPGLDEGPSLITSIKSELEDPELNVESVFVSGVGADFVSTKLVVDEHNVFDPGSVTDPCEITTLNRDTLDIGQDLRCEGQSHASPSAHTNDLQSVAEDKAEEMACDQNIT